MISLIVLSIRLTSKLFTLVYHQPPRASHKNRSRETILQNKIRIFGDTHMIAWAEFFSGNRTNHQEINTVHLLNVTGELPFFLFEDLKPK